MRLSVFERWRTSFRFRLMVATVLAITVMVALYSGVQYFRHVHAAEAAQRERAERLASLMAESLAQPMFDFNTVAVTLAVKALGSHTDIRWVRVTDNNGDVVVDTGTEITASELLLTLSRPITYSDAPRLLEVGNIQLAFSRKSLDEELYKGSMEILFGGLLVAFATVLAALWSFRSITHPLSEITEGLDRLAAGHVDILVPAVPRDDEFGRMHTAMGRFRDALLESQRAESAIRANEERFRDFSESSADWFWEMDASLRFSFFSENFAQILGVDPQRLLGKTRITIADFAELNQTEARADLLARLSRREAFRGVEYRARKADGSLLWVSVSGVPHFAADGGFLGYRGVGQDVTARRLAEETARKLSQAVEQSPSNVVITNAAAEIEYVNEAFTSVTGYSRDEALGKNPRFLASGLTAPEVFTSLWGALSNGMPWQGELINRRKNGEVYIEYALLTPLREPDGTVSHYLAIKEDVTEKKQVEHELDGYRHHLEQMVEERTAELALAKDAAEAASRAKGSFVANMSHEIRTPLNAVLGLARIIVRENEGRKSGRTASQILQAGEHLLGVINDVLDFSRIEAGKMLIELRPFRLLLCVEEAIKLVADRARAKQLNLTLDRGLNIPVWVEGDRLRVEQILINLLSNAVKFTERGDVTLSLSRSGERILFKVADSGIGMSVDQVSRLFQPFEQADASTTRKYGGSGLGLTISRSLAQQMGGEISVESHVGQGSVFELSLPLREVADDGVVSLVPEGGQRLAGLRVLAVEDMELNRIVLEDMLENEGATLVFAEQGQQALALLEARGPAAFDLVLTDIQMPIMDGYELAQRIRILQPSMPVIGLTAHAMPEERQRCIASGMLAHISKPIDCDVLVSTLLQYASPHAIVSPVPMAATKSAAAASVMMIDWNALADRYRGRDAFAEKLFAILLRTHDGTPLKLRNAARAHDVETLRSIAHTLQGVAGNVEAVSVCELAQQLERGIGEGRDDKQALAEQLASSLDDLLAMLRERTGLGAS